MVVEIVLILMMTLLLYMSPENLSARLETLTRALDDYWIQWRDEYLLQLRERSHATRNVGHQLVEVHDEHCPRSLWKSGRVTELITGNDGQV